MSSCVLLSVYRPGSSAVTASFLSELGDLLDRFSTFVEPLVLAGDINIRLERSTDPHAVEFRELLDSYGLTQHVQDVTHDEGGILLFLTSFALAATYLHQKLPLATLVFLTTVCSDGCHRSSVRRQSTQPYVAGHGGPSL